MSLLLPDYSSSSEDEDTPRIENKQTALAPAPTAPTKLSTCVAASTEESLLSIISGTEPPTKPAKKTKKKQKKHAKTTLFLPPEIQRLLESGNLGDSDDDGDDASDSLLAKQKRANAKRPRNNAVTGQQATATALSFLPAPKHQLPEATRTAEPVSEAATAPVDSTANAEAPTVAEDIDPHAYAAHDGAAYQQYYQQHDPQYYLQQQEYQQQQQQQYYEQQAYDMEQQQQQPASKRARHRDRELERMLQMGQFDSVADQIVEVHAPAPDSWQAPVEQIQKGTEGELKVKASFWNSSAGTAVATVKPSRLQRQKHQLNQLAFDAKAREFDLLDRKGAAIKTKRETHAKYGW